MKLVAVTVQSFRNFDAAQRIQVESDVTVLIGKNESGKTTILQALHRLNPANGDDKEFDLVTEYPRWRLASDRRSNPDIQQVAPVQAEFELTEEEVQDLAEIISGPLLPTSRVLASRTYANALKVSVVTPVEDIIAAAAEDASVAGEDVAELARENDFEFALVRAKELTSDLKPTDPPRSRALRAFVKEAEKYRFHLPGGQLDNVTSTALAERIPKFFYFSNYSVLPGETDLTGLATKAGGGQPISEKERTLLSLLHHAGVQPADFLDTNYDSRKAELQATALELSREVFKYWRANTDLEVVFGEDLRPVVEQANSPAKHHRFLKIELRDGRHGNVETNFSTRSSGFQWFFSFFAAFSEYQRASEPVIVLLDEPGTSLHGEAQKDFVRYIFEELGASKQTLYTTHSQFMIDPTVYEKLRAVHDRATREDHEAGVEVSNVNLSADRDTVLPVESALGYSISQHLFIGSGQHLLVEGSSDFIYLFRMSAYFETQGMPGLSPELSIIPVGGIANMPAFVALMGRRLDVSALVDGEKSSSVLQRTRNAARDNSVPAKRIVSVGEIDSQLPREADIEDLFAVGDYLKLYNWAFNKSLDESDLPGGQGRILSRIESFGGSVRPRPASSRTDSEAGRILRPAGKRV